MRSFAALGVNAPNDIDDSDFLISSNSGGGIFNMPRISTKVIPNGGTHARIPKAWLRVTSAMPTPNERTSGTVTGPVVTPEESQAMHDTVSSLNCDMRMAIG
mmetsp:Transcript_20578/g.38643  ORF Transcript_20578/g.38643 Transcript_20578/m.38643 type:complete len:102 (+) Transcript_20578:234-539(+)